jgi:pimeloyl-ACP methyl ester carboxylesterase
MHPIVAGTSGADGWGAVMGPTPVILVHGLWHQPEHLAPLAAALEQCRIGVAAPRLHRGSFEGDVAAVQAAVDASDAPPLLVGHSYGGAVITAVTGAAHLVYLIGGLATRSGAA